MKVIITGGAGMLGREITEVLEALSHRQTDEKPSRPSGHWSIVSGDLDQLDITNEKQVGDAFSKVRPDVVVNCAAYTDVDGCERNPELAFRVNARGSRVLAEEAARLKALLVHVSTDFVFDGEKSTPYREEDEPNPLSVYGISKLQGELAIRNSGCDHIIARTAWLYGPYGKNFIWSFVIQHARSGKGLRVVTDQVGSPSYTLDVSHGILALIQSEARGLFHLANKGACSRLELAKAALEEAAVAASIEPISTKKLALPAHRPSYSVLATHKFEKATGKAMPHWRSALRNFMARMKTVDTTQIA